MPQSFEGTSTMLGTDDEADSPPPATARRALRERASDRAPHFGGPAQFEALVDSQIVRCRRQGVPLAVLVLVVDSVHGASGQIAAPEVEHRVLAECAHRLCSRVRATDQVVRIGARGFGVVLVGAGESAARSVSLRLALAGGGLYRLGEQLLELRLRVGQAAFPEGGGSGAALVRTASF